MFVDIFPDLIDKETRYIVYSKISITPSLFVCTG